MGWIINNKKGVAIILLTPQQPGAPKGIRTPDLQIRSLPLYPAELWARNYVNVYFSLINFI